MAAAAAIGSTEKKYAVVTGSNKGIGFEICKKLASKDGITVVLTARDEKKGLDALQKLNELGFSDNVIFHQLDVTSSSSVSSLAEFVKNQFGRLDILINNAGVNGVITDAEAVKNLNPNDAEGVDFSKIYTETYELAEECFQINYYGMKRTTEAFLPLLQLSSSPRIVNVSSIMGQLKNIQNEWAKGILRDISNLTEERVDEVINELLKDFKEGTLAIKGWPTFFGAYQFSKVVVNAYTRILAKKYPNFKVNCVCPGFAKTDLNHGLGLFTAEEVAENPVRLALLPYDGPSGLFFDRSEESSFE